MHETEDVIKPLPPKQQCTQQRATTIGSTMARHNGISTRHCPFKTAAIDPRWRPFSSELLSTGWLGGEWLTFDEDDAVRRGVHGCGGGGVAHGADRQTLTVTGTGRRGGGGQEIGAAHVWVSALHTYNSVRQDCSLYTFIQVHRHRLSLEQWE